MRVSGELVTTKVGNATQPFKEHALIANILLELCVMETVRIHPCK